MSWRCGFNISAGITTLKPNPAEADRERETEVLWERYEGQAEFDNGGGDGVQKNVKRTKERERDVPSRMDPCVCVRCILTGV